MAQDLDKISCACGLGGVQAAGHRRVAQANPGCPRRAGRLLVWERVSDIRSGYDLVWNSSPDAPTGITDFQIRFPDKLRLSGAPNAQVVACLGHPSLTISSRHCRSFPTG